MDRNKRELCEFNSATGTWAYSDDADGCQNEATVCVGTNGIGHLCAECADLPRFKKYKKTPFLRPIPEQAAP